MFWFAITICVVALVFDFLNGFHDAANPIATVVSTRVLSPRLAVLWAAFFNFVAAFTFDTAVAKTMGRIMGVGSIQRLSAVLSGVARSIVWAWVLTIPVSGAVAAVVLRIIRLLSPAACVRWS